MSGILSTIRCTALAITVAAIASLMAPMSAEAQIPGCICKTVPVTVTKDVGCCVSLVFAGTNEFIKTFCPGATDFVLCEDNLTVSVVDCNGTEHPLSWWPKPCIGPIAITADGCCVEVCWVKTDDGCYGIEIRPSNVDCACK